MSDTYFEISINPRDDFLINHPNAFCLKPKEDISWEKTCHYIDLILEQGDGIIFFIDAERNDDQSPGKSYIEYNQWFYIHVDPRHGYKINWRLNINNPDLKDIYRNLISVNGSEEKVQFGRHDDYIRKKSIFTDYKKMRNIIKYIFDHGEVPEGMGLEFEENS